VVTVEQHLWQIFPGSVSAAPEAVDEQHQLARPTVGMPMQVQTGALELFLAEPNLRNLIDQQTQRGIVDQRAPHLRRPQHGTGPLEESASRTRRNMYAEAGQASWPGRDAGSESEDSGKLRQI
jgi:hypothetical protein